MRGVGDTAVRVLVTGERLADFLMQLGSVISPGHIFNTATDAGMMFQLDLAARKSAVQKASQLDIGDRWLSINFNPTAIYYCLRTTVSACEQLGLDPSSIVFEVTETEQIKDVRHLRGILAFYRKAGFRVAVDDVGAGYYGLNILQTLSPDVIKIDRHLITDIDKDSFKQNIVEHLVSMAHRQDIRVLGEGVETAGEVSFVEQVGADLIQDYYFGRPKSGQLREDAVQVPVAVMKIPVHPVQ